MSITNKPINNFNPSKDATTAFRRTFNDWRVTPLDKSHATWERNSNEFHITTELKGGIKIRDDFKIK